MAVNQEFKAFIEDQLSEFEGFECKKMFGGLGFFREGMMFGMLGGNTFRLKVDEINQPDYEAYGMQAYHSKKKGKGMPYWEVPQEILEDRSKLADWAARAFEAAQRAKSQ